MFEFTTATLLFVFPSLFLGIGSFFVNVTQCENAVKFGVSSRLDDFSRVLRLSWNSAGLFTTIIYDIDTVRSTMRRDAAKTFKLLMAFVMRYVNLNPCIFVNLRCWLICLFLSRFSCLFIYLFHFVGALSSWEPIFSCVSVGQNLNILLLWRVFGKSRFDAFKISHIYPPSGESLFNIETDLTPPLFASQSRW